jgi:uncharacterized protein YndB with AHSA1/START domain
MNSQVITPAPVRKSVQVNTTPQHAFDVFTRNITRWWPASHSILKAPLKETIIEPLVGGRWYQVGQDGSECENGRVLVWAPPHRLILSWQINADWQYDPALETEVEVNFIADGERATRVELEHRYLERMGAKGEIARAAVDSPNGWSALLELFRQSAEA